MAIELGADYSTYVQPEITQNRANNFRAAGIVRMCLAMDAAPETINSAQALHAAGINLDGYRELSGPSNYASQTMSGIAAFPLLAAKQIYVRRYWLTAEDVSVGIRPDILVPALHSAVAAATGYDVGIYSGFWYWPTYMANVADFAKLPLWHAGYDHIPGLGTVNYGGWSGAPNAHQYDSPIVVDGIGLDVDAWWVDDVPAPPGPTPGPGPNIAKVIVDLQAVLAELQAA
jgi:hypothetical protein